MHLACYQLQLEQGSSSSIRTRPLSPKILAGGAQELLSIPRTQGRELYLVFRAREAQQSWEKALAQHLDNAVITPECEQIVCIERLFEHLVGLDVEAPGSPECQMLIETQITEAAQQGTLGPVFARILREGIQVAEKIRQSTSLTAGATEPIDVIPEVVAKIVEHASTVLILGDEEDTPLLSEVLTGSGFQRLFITHPDAEAANEMALYQASLMAADSPSCLPVEWGQRHSVLQECDAAVCLWSDGEPALSFPDSTPFLRKRKSRPLVIVDCSESALDAKQGLDARFQSLDNTFVYTRRDLEEIVQQNLQRRRSAIPQAKKLIAQQAQACLQHLYGSDRYLFHGMVARSHQMHGVLELARRAAASDANILIQGETGTGKELLAKAVHQQSPRAKHPFIVVNCGAIPEDLLESELFGHVRGSFTGALSDKRGLLAAAHHGTLLLDEIGDMSLALQVKLLRALQEGEIRPVGSLEVNEIDVRILASTHRDLEELIHKGEFREDLYYRLNVIQITIPPLRERKEDIPPMAEAFLKRFAPSTRLLGRRSSRTLRLHPDAEQKLLTHDWPGNIRELENVIERAVALSLGPAITLASLPAGLKATGAEADVEEALAEQWTLRDLEARYIERTLQEHQWNYSKVCEILGISRTTLWRKMNEYDLAKEETNG